MQRKIRIPLTNSQSPIEAQVTQKEIIISSSLSIKLKSIFSIKKTNLKNSKIKNVIKAKDNTIGSVAGTNKTIFYYEKNSIYFTVFEAGQEIINLPQLNILFFVNPFGGTKKAEKIFEKIKKFLLISNSVYTKISTEFQFHAQKFILENDVRNYDVICCVSGDGLVNEVVDALMQKQIKKKVCVIPAGTGNALAKSLNTPSPETAVVSLLQGKSCEIDLIKMTNLNTKQVKFGFLEFLWAFVADVDLESEHMRWAGSLRNILTAIVRLIRLRRYKGTFYYPATSTTKEAEDITSLSTIPSSWKSISSVFTYFMAMNTTHCATDFLVCPDAKINDGLLDIVYTKNISAWKMLKLMLNTENCSYYNEGWVNKLKVDRFVLDAGNWSFKDDGGEDGEGIKSSEEGLDVGLVKNKDGCLLDLDGEKVDYGCVYVEVLKGAGEVIVPVDFNELDWKRDWKHGGVN